MNIFLEIFLIIDAFIIGVVATFALRHGLAHFRPEKHDAEPQPRPQNGHLDPEARKQMQEKALTNFQAVIDRASTQLQGDLQASEARLTGQLEKLSKEIINKEMARYHDELDRIRQRAENADKSAETELSQHQVALKAKMEQEIAEEKQRKVEQLDARISDAVTSFLLETLGHEADLGAQSKYLLAQLEAHKSEIIDGVKDGA